MLHQSYVSRPRWMNSPKQFDPDQQATPRHCDQTTQQNPGHRQTGQLPGRAAPGDARGGAPSVEVSEQPGGELPQPTRQRERAMNSAHRAEPSGFCRRSAASPRTFGHTDIDSPHPATATRWTPDSQYGTRSSACPQPPDPVRRTATSPVRTTRPPPMLNNLTMPPRAPYSLPGTAGPSSTVRGWGPGHLGLAA